MSVAHTEELSAGAEVVKSFKYKCLSCCCCAGGDMADTKDRTKQKACLERYRRACIEILSVLNKAAPQVKYPTLSLKCA